MARDEVGFDPSSDPRPMLTRQSFCSLQLGRSDEAAAELFWFQEGSICNRDDAKQVSEYNRVSVQVQQGPIYIAYTVKSQLFRVKDPFHLITPAALRCFPHDRQARQSTAGTQHAMRRQWSSVSIWEHYSEKPFWGTWGNPTQKGHVKTCEKPS